MKTLSFLILFLAPLLATAENSRAPAVLDPVCDLNIPTTMTIVQDGKSVEVDKSPEQVLKEQCKEIKECIASADDEDLPELKSLEEVACNAKLTAVNTRTPTIEADKHFDGKRKAKELEDKDLPKVIPASTIITKPK